MTFDRVPAASRPLRSCLVFAALVVVAAAAALVPVSAGEVDVAGADELEVAPTAVAVAIETRVPAPFDDVLEHLTGRELFLADDAIREVEEIDVTGSGWPGAFAGVTFPSEAVGVIRRMLRDSAAKDVNLSAEEHERLVKAVGGATDPKLLQSRFAPEFRGILGARLGEYRAHGVALGYRRPGGATDITDVYRKAITRWESDHLPFGDGSRHRDRYFWVRREVAGTRVYSLAHLRYGRRQTDRELEARVRVVEFYVSAEYDGSLLQIDLTAIPVDGDHHLTQIEAAGHAISDRVTGTLGALKRPIARRRLAGTHRRQFNRLREALRDAR